MNCGGWETRGHGKPGPRLGRAFRCACGTPLTANDQVAADKRVKVAVEYSVYIAYLDPRAQVFGDAVGLQHIRTDLRAKVDVELGRFTLLLRPLGMDSSIRELGSCSF
jgi:hypothetical protein